MKTVPQFASAAWLSQLKKTYSLLLCAATHWSADGASMTAAALAFFCAFSLAPLLVILLTIAGWIVGSSDAAVQIEAQLTGLFGPATANTLLAAMQSSQHPGGLIATAASAVTLLIGATTVLSALENALERIWESASPVPVRVRGWLRARLTNQGTLSAAVDGLEWRARRISTRAKRCSRINLQSGRRSRRRGPFS